MRSVPFQQKRIRGDPLVTPAVGHALRVWAVLGAAAAAALVLAMSVGSSNIPMPDVIRLLLHPEASATSQVIHELRLPRALAALAAGGLLALAGALMQVLLRNPLADPYVLGLSSGAAVGALGAMLLGLAGFLVNAGAFIGALLTVALVFTFASRDLGQRQGLSGADASPRLLLTGVILASGWSAIITVILVVAPESKLRGMLFWLMGDLSGADTYGAALIALPIATLALVPVARELNVMLRGHDLAHAMGVPVVTLRRAILLVASLATAIAVTTVGAVGFVGLIVPHALRLVIGNDQRVLLPACALAGGTLLLLADTVARTAFSPQQVPVGVVMSMLGVPTFMLLLMRRQTP